MVFALCTDDNYAMPCMVCVTSIFENNVGEECKVYVLTSGLSSVTVKKFERLAALYNQQIVISVVAEDAFAKLKTRHRYGTSMYFRFLLPDIAKESKVLYLDCDIVVHQNLSELWEMDIQGYACAVVEDQRGDEVELRNRVRISTPYFNSGVLMMNLDYWRTNNVRDALSDYIENNPEKCFFPDQDALNAVLAEKVLYLEYTYNFQEQWYWEEERICLHFTKFDKILQYRDNPAIVHYTWNQKPWMEQCFHPHRDWFLQYAKLHDFLEYKETPRYKPSFMSRVYAFILRKCISGIRRSDNKFRVMNRTDILAFFNIE